MKRYDRIVVDPDIMFGKPVIAGTRISVESILRKLAGGLTTDQILKDHPHLRVEDIFAAEEFAADYLSEEEIVFADRG
ncbi:MAG: DUF433 domain-containing protein [Bacteroidetes bacterium]|nr:DUF433 domain-containing protein [Bacteroidota bacterium]